MKQLLEYDRDAAVAYAQRWALRRNPKYNDYEHWGGDCTNFVSQCLYTGKIPLDHSGDEEYRMWYWYSDKERTPSWTSAELLYQYIIRNNNEKTQNFGVYARVAAYNELDPGDIVQLVYNGKAFHSMLITEVMLEGEYLLDYLIAAHTYDLLNSPLSMKKEEKRYIKILGYYK